MSHTTIKEIFILIVFISTCLIMLGQCCCCKIKCKKKRNSINIEDLQGRTNIVQAIPIQNIDNEIIVIGQASPFNIDRTNAIIVDAYIINEP